MLNSALEEHTCKRMLTAKIFRTDADQQRAVGVDAVACVVAHAVGDDAVFFAGGGDDRSAGTHAERINAPSARQVEGELVILPRRVPDVRRLRRIGRG